MFLSADGQQCDVTRAAAATLAGLFPLDAIGARTDGRDLGRPICLRLAEQGWLDLALDLALDDRASGADSHTSVDTALFFREVGRVIGPIDILAQNLAVACTRGSDLERHVSRGELGIALAIEDEDTRVPGVDDAPRSSMRLLGGGATPEIAVLVKPDGIRTLETRGLDLIRIASLDPVTGLRRIRGSEPRVVSHISGTRFWRFGQLAATGMLVGAAEAALDMIVEYAKVRHTFGRPIGTYQAVRHPCADMLLRVEAARCQLWYAAAAVDEGHKDADMHLSAAKHLANTAAIRNTDGNIQLHGGIGVTEEHQAHYFLKHALLLSRLFGSSRMALAALMKDTGSEVRDFEAIEA
jgi:Acyl-CoA dehydrogenase, C-terminal domain